MKKITEQQLIESARALATTLQELNPDISAHTGNIKSILDTEKQGRDQFFSRFDKPPVLIPDRDGTMQEYPGWLPLPDRALPPKPKEIPYPSWLPKGPNQRITQQDELEMGAQNLANITKPQPSSPQRTIPATAVKQSAKKAAVKQRDPKVKQLQTELRAKGYDIKVDGIMGPETRQALAYDQEFGADYAEKTNKAIAQANESLTRIMELTKHSFHDTVQKTKLAETTASFRDLIDSIEEATQPGFVSPQSINPPATKPLPQGVGGILDQATVAPPKSTSSPQQSIMKPQSPYASIMNPGARSTANTGTPQPAKPSTAGAKQTAKPSTAGADIFSNPAAVRDFQKANGLKDDGLIGPITLDALKKAGFQPPAGFKMAPAKKPAQAQLGVTQADYDAAEAEYQQNKAAHDAEYNAKIDAIKAPRQQAATAAAAPQPGMSTALGAASQAMTPAFQSQQAPAQATPEEMKAAKAAVAAYKPNPKAKPYDADYGTNVPGAPGTKEYDLVNPPAPEPVQQPTTPLSQEPVVVYKESSDQEMSKFKSLISVEDMFDTIQEAREQISFNQGDQIARIIQLVNR